MSTNISTFLTNKDNISFIYNSTVELSAADNLVEGQYVLCLGYNDITDGCRTVFRIVDKNYNAGEVDYYIDLNNNLKAELIIENDTVNILQLGGRPVAVDNTTFDNKDAFDRYLDLIRSKGNVPIYRLYIPFGVWCTSPVNIDIPVWIEGSHNSFEQYTNVGTTITSYEDGQSHLFAVRPPIDTDPDNNITLHTEYTDTDSGVFTNPNDGFKLDSDKDYVYVVDTEDNNSSDNRYNPKCPHNFIFRNVTFSSGVYEYQTDGNYFKAIDSETKSIYSALRFHYSNFGTFENISFNHIIGRCMTINSSWEFRFFGNTNILNCGKLGGALIVFDKVCGSKSPINSYPNISNFEINNLNVEAVIGDVFKVENGCRLMDTVVQNLHFETGYQTNILAHTGVVYGEFEEIKNIIGDDEGGEKEEFAWQYKLPEGYTAYTMGIFNIKGSCKLVVNNIILNNVSYRFVKPTESSNDAYIYDTVFFVSDTPTKDEDPYCERITMGVNVGNIMIHGIKLDYNIIKTNNALIHYDSYFTLNSVGFGSKVKTKCMFNVQNFPSIICNGKIDNFRYNRVSTMSNDFNACYKNVYNYYLDKEPYKGDNDGYINYDPDSLNDLNLVVKPKTDITGAPFITVPIKGSILCVRAKITAGFEYYPYLRSVQDKTVYLDADDKNGCMTGTGEYKLYEINISNLTNNEVVKNNPLVDILTSSKTTWESGKEVSLDTYYFKD